MAPRVAACPNSRPRARNPAGSVRPRARGRVTGRATGRRRRWWAEPGRKSEAPRAALRAEACAPPGATPGSEGDPPPIVPRALASVSTNVIARRSLRFGGRSAFADCLPGCPVPSSTVKPLRTLLPPVAQLLRPSPRLPPRSPRLPGSTASAPSPLTRRLAARTQDHPPTGSASTS